MGRGRGGRYSLSRLDDFEVDFDFEIFSSDENGNDITPTSTTANGITTYTFAGAVNNFQSRLEDTSDNFAIDVGWCVPRLTEFSQKKFRYQTLVSKNFVR